MTHRLYCFGESGNAYKAALTLALCGIDWEPVFVDFFHGGTRTPEYRAINAMGEVPALVTDGGEVMTQSGVIQLWAGEQSGKYIGETEKHRREVLRWMFFDNHKVSGVAGPLRFNMNFLPEDRRNADVIGFMTMRLNSALKVMEAELGTRDWLAGDAPTLADFANCGYLFYPEPFNFSRADWPNIDRWLDRLSALPGWKHPYDLMPGSPADRA